MINWYETQAEQKIAQERYEPIIRERQLARAQRLASNLSGELNSYEKKSITVKFKMLAIVGSMILVGLLLTTTVLAYGVQKAGEPDGLATIRQATARYHELDVALADGYEQLFDCTVNPNDPTEAMGQHYINNGLVDSTLELDKPEVLMYEPQPNGQMKLVSVEYIIFEDSWDQPDPPQFLGQTLKRKTVVGTHEVPPFFEVHAWVWKHNPGGVFADWNPNVSCEYQ